MTGDKLLNVHQLGQEGADIQGKIEELEQLNQSMRDRDKMKDDDDSTSVGSTCGNNNTTTRT